MKSQSGYAKIRVAQHQFCGGFLRFLVPIQFGHCADVVNHQRNNVGAVSQSFNFSMDILSSGLLVRLVTGFQFTLQKGTKIQRSEMRRSVIGKC